MVSHPPGTDDLRLLLFIQNDWCKQSGKRTTFTPNKVIVQKIVE